VNKVKKELESFIKQEEGLYFGSSAPRFRND
jgi:hypothetical protein